ncbi:MAG TPA: response regulator transcription factor [Mycobacteriales bacterium]|nr:response regulator transcription factor [Mycobacteriales bacterium]
MPAGRLKAMPMPIRVLLCDECPVWRAGFRTVLDAEPDIVVAGEVADGCAALMAASVLQPDVVLIDAALPDLNGIEVTRQLAGPQVDNPLRILMLTAAESQETLVEALRAGARGYLPKGLAGEALVAAVRSVAAGDASMTPPTLRRLLDGIASWLPPTRPSRSPEVLDRLSRREREVLMLVARGLTNKEIAEHLALSLTTVKSHVSHILAKLRLQERAQAVVAAYEAGLVQPGLETPDCTLDRSRATPVLSCQS